MPAGRVPGIRNLAEAALPMNMFHRAMLHTFADERCFWTLEPPWAFFEGMDIGLARKAAFYSGVGNSGRHGGFLFWFAAALFLSFAVLCLVIRPWAACIAHAPRRIAWPILSLYVVTLMWDCAGRPFAGD